MFSFYLSAVGRGGEAEYKPCAVQRSTVNVFKDAGVANRSKNFKVPRARFKIKDLEPPFSLI